MYKAILGKHVTLYVQVEWNSVFWLLLCSPVMWLLLLCRTQLNDYWIYCFVFVYLPLSFDWTHYNKESVHKPHTNPNCIKKYIRHHVPEILNLIWWKDQTFIQFLKLSKKFLRMVRRESLALVYLAWSQLHCLILLRELSGVYTLRHAD